MNIIPLSSIIVHPKRQRSSLPEDHIRALKDSIERDGLIHALAITQERELVAGYCRMTAISRMVQEYTYDKAPIPVGHVPVVYVDSEDPTAVFRIELEENLRRKSLSPVDEAKAIAKLHELLRESAPGQGELETGHLLNKLRGEDKADPTLRQEMVESLLIASMADDPDVKKASSRREAYSAAKKKLEQEFRSALGQLAPRQTREDLTLIEGDAHVELARLPDKSFAGIICDPPYGIRADTFGDQAHISDHRYEDDEESADSLVQDIFIQGARISTDDAHLYLFCDIRRVAAITLLAQHAGWTPYPTPLIWHKPNAGHAPQVGYFTRRYEAILFLRKGNRTLQFSSPDVMTFNSAADKVHAAQKPVELYAHLMKLSFFPGERVLDPCAGSGTVFRAARLAGLKATGIELDATSANQCRVAIGES